MPETTTDAPREKLNKKAITADHPTWCPGCGDFANSQTGFTGFFRIGLVRIGQILSRKRFYGRHDDY
jgi:hypothetical protein